MGFVSYSPTGHQPNFSCSKIEAHIYAALVHVVQSFYTFQSKVESARRCIHYACRRALQQIVSARMSTRTLDWKDCFKEERKNE